MQNSVADFAEAIKAEVQGEDGFCAATKKTVLKALEDRKSIALLFTKPAEKTIFEEKLYDRDCVKGYEAGLGIFSLD